MIDTINRSVEVIADINGVPIPQEIALECDIPEESFKGVFLVCKPKDVIDANYSNCLRSVREDTATTFFSLATLIELAKEGEVDGIIHYSPEEGPHPIFV